MSDNSIIRYDHGTLKLPFEPNEFVEIEERMFHACFTLLGDFVENQLGTKEWFENSNSMYRGYRCHFAGNTNEKAIDLWLWYRDELEVLEEDYARDVNEYYEDRPLKRGPGWIGPVAIENPRSLELKYPYGYIKEVKSQKLTELIAMRRNLWI